MSDPYGSLDLTRAQRYLTSLTPEAQRLGEECFRLGQVRELTPCREGEGFSARVEAEATFRVDLEYSRILGWIGHCTCPQREDCQHAYAAMKAVLAEFSVAEVRRLSAGKRRRSGSRESSTSSGEFAREVEAALGRRLGMKEKAFLDALTAIHWRCLQQGLITAADFHRLLPSVPLDSYRPLNLWPEVPRSEREFWLFLAYAALERGGAIPPFMRPVTDLSPIRETVAEMRRQEEIQRWQELLEREPQGQTGLRVELSGIHDLRLKVQPTLVTLEWKRPGRETFEVLRQQEGAILAEDYRTGRATFVSEAEPIWRVCYPRIIQGFGFQLYYLSAETSHLLGALLRHHALGERLVDLKGNALARPVEPLRWSVIPAEDERADYRLRLVQGDGQPAPPILWNQDGQPPLYLCQHSLFTGPPTIPHVLQLDEENRIPAPALESVGGVRLLRALRTELPQRIEERIRQVDMQVEIHCSLRALRMGSPTEVCLICLRAKAADGSRVEIWHDGVWMVVEENTQPGSGRSRSSTIPFYDRSALDRAPDWLGRLDCRTDSQTGLPSLRVTRKFPEIFVPWLKSLPPEVPVILEGDLASLASDAVSGRVRLEVTGDEEAIDWFDLRVVLDVEDASLTPEEIRMLLNARGGFVRLEDKGWRRLEFELTPEEDEQLARIGLNPRELSAEPQRLHALQLADAAAREFLPADQFEQIHRRAGELQARVTPPIPAGITASLRPYQVDGFHFLTYLSANGFGGILADDMGLGKTLQALAWLLWLRAGGANDGAVGRATGPTAERVGPDSAEPGGRPGSPPALVVCPKSVMDNWQAEAERFASGLRVRICRSGEVETFFDRLGEADLHVINYSQLRLLAERLAAVTWLAVILDEGQYIKNPDSQTAQVARALRADHRLVLSGTPIENRLLDLWSLMAFAMPGMLGNRSRFGQLYNAKDDPFARRRLSARVRPFLLRRTKRQVARDLPERIEEDLFCEIEGEQLALYRAELKLARALLLKIKTQKQLARLQFHFLTSLLRLRQICCHPALVKPDTKAESAKVAALFEQLEPLMEEGHKVLVFSQFVELLALLEPEVARRNWPRFRLAGDTENRGEVVRRFQEAEGPAVFLISLKAGGFGLNLTAASYVVLFDPWWNPAVENQAIDRTHRIGQTQTVIAYRLLIKESIEEKIRILQKRKQALAEDVLGEEKFAQNLTIEDLQYLFS